MRSPPLDVTQAGVLWVVTGKTDEAKESRLLVANSRGLSLDALRGGWRRLSAKSPLTWRDHQIRPKGLSTKSWVLRMYFASMASDECPVCARMLDDDAPDMAALVAKPDRKL